jgi:D-glycero-alpha-D-manno-heptose-7-phosphate kinase
MIIKGLFEGFSMLIVRSPLRISLAGGGTDLPAYYEKFGGAVINLAIDRYFYVFLRTSFQKDIQITSADFQTYDRMNGEMDDSWRGVLMLPRAVFHHFGITHGVNVFLASEVPPGTGLGSSSTVTVGLIKAVITACGIQMTKMEIAELASYIEIEKLGSPIGKQDQYAAAFGNLNLHIFEKDKTTVIPLEISHENLMRIGHNLLLFYTGKTRSANQILSQMGKATGKKSSSELEALHCVKKMVFDVKASLEKGDIEALGAFLHENWIAKKRFADGVSNEFIDNSYKQALELGALGGKICGAGGGGFLLLCCPEHRHDMVIDGLMEFGLKEMPFSIDHSGALVVMNAGLRLTSRHSWSPPLRLYKSI